MIFVLQKDSSTKLKSKTATKLEETSGKFSYIRCPSCKWQPKKHHLWQCTPCQAPEFFQEGCGTAWHTFDTKGKCPGCKYQWKYTKCISCMQWSLHQDWYVRADQIN